MGVHLTDAELEVASTRVDNDGKGDVSFSEFYDWYCSEFYGDGVGGRGVGGGGSESFCHQDGHDNNCGISSTTGVTTRKSKRRRGQRGNARKSPSLELVDGSAPVVREASSPYGKRLPRRNISVVRAAYAKVQSANNRDLDKTKRVQGGGSSL